MNLDQMRVLLRARIGNPSELDVPSTPNLDSHINNACQEVLNKYKFKKRRARARFTTQVGIDKYNVRQMTDVIYKVWDRTNGKELERVGKSILAEKDYDASPNALVQNAKPAQWTYIEAYLQLLPPPDGEYDIEFIYKVLYTPLVNSGDVPVVPLPWHRGIVILASSMFYDDEGGDPMKATYHRNAFKDWLSNQPVEEDEETEAIDSGVELPSLGRRSDKRLDFDSSI